jgi:hypothetical protein
MTDNLIQTKFTERVNAEKALAIQQLSHTELKALFWDPEEVDKSTGKKRNWSSYFLNVRKYLKQSVAKNGIIQKDYKFGKFESGGRLYVENGGIQGFQSKIRNFLCGEFYYDFDIKNAHPSILLHICNKFNINAPNLKEYVLNRQKILTENDLTKTDILIAINRDNNKKKRDNDFYNPFIKELERIKKDLLENIKNLDIKTNNEDNPISSLINKYMLRYEADIIQRVIKYFGKHAEIPMFDGIMVNKNFSKEDEINNHVDKINDLFKEEYDGLIKFDIKSTESDIQLNMEKEFVVADYCEVKPKFEEKHFQTISPFIFWKESKRPDGSYSYNQLRDSDFKIACEEYKIIDYNAKGQLITPSIYKRWIEDPKKRKYQCIDFVPYGKENKCSAHCYNTFEGFEVNKTTEYEEVNTDNFDTMIQNLCNFDDEMTEYLTKYIAHMFQYPDTRTERIIVLKGWTGTGKDTLYRTLDRMMGSKYIDITEDPNALFGNFNSILNSKLGLFLNELEGSDGIRFQERLKALATNYKNKVNDKNEKIIEQNNYCRMFVSSNNDGCVNIQVSDRRFVIVKTGFGLVQNIKDKTKSKENEKFWTKYYNCLNDKNWIKSLYNKLMNIDLSDYNVKDSPVGDDKKIMKEKNISPIYKYLHNIIETSNYNDFLIKSIKNEKLHLIKFKTLASNLRSWIDDEGIQSDFIIKDTAIKQKLINCDNSFLPSKQIMYEINGEKRKDKFSVFNMERMKHFLDNFIFTDDDEEIEDLGELEVGTKN